MIELAHQLLYLTQVERSRQDDQGVRPQIGVAELRPGAHPHWLWLRSRRPPGCASGCGATPHPLLPGRARTGRPCSPATQYDGVDQVGHLSRVVVLKGEHSQPAR